MQKIDNYNFDWTVTCCEKFCDNKATQFETIEVNGISIVVTLCIKHAVEWEKKRNADI